VAASTNKKVLVARFDRETLAGFVSSPGGLEPRGLENESLDLLTPAGNVVQVPYSEVKAICFVRDFEGGDTWRAHRAFLTRPKSAGLWVRLRFRDGDSLEGMLANNLLLVEPGGFTVVPPDPTFHNQRIFVPRAALADVQVLGVIGSALRRRPSKRPDKGQGQLEMFEG
jgi:hypothetical protein